MNNLSWKAKTYILTIILAGTALLVWLLANIRWENLWMLVALCGFASIFLIFKVEGTTNRTHYNISFLIYAFTFTLYGPGAAALVILVSNLAEWAWHKYPWYIQCFNIGAFSITIFLTGLISQWLNPEHILLGFSGIASFLAAVGIFTLVNHLMVGIVVWLARGENFSKSGIFDHLPLIIDFTLLIMGICGALLWTLTPFAVLLILLPLYLIYITLRVPALERQTLLDSKTGLYNAQYFAHELENELQRAIRFDRPLTVVMGDLDLLRNINNTYGHLAGDQVLIGIAAILKEKTREYDTVCRFGGEEFAILIPESNADQVFPHIEAIRQAICTTQYTVPTSVTPINASMSFGIASRDGFSQTANDIVHNADVALYHAKLNGRNQTAIYSSEAYHEILAGNHPVFLEPSPISLNDRIQPASFPPISNPIREAAERVQEVIKPEEPAPIPAEPPKKQPSKWKVNFYIGAVACFALLLLSLSIRLDQPVDYLGLAVFGVVLILTEWFSVELYVRDTSVSTSAVPILAGVLLFGPPAAVLFSIIFAAVTMLKHRILLSRFIFNSSNQLIATLLIINMALWIGGPFIDLPIGSQILVSVLASGILFISTTILIALAIKFDAGVSFKQIWKEKFSWLAPSYLAMGLIACLLVFGYKVEGLVGILITLLPLYMLRLSQVQYLDRTKGMVSELREKNQTLENTAREITDLNDGLLETMAAVIDHRDPYVLEHSKNVAQYAVGIATHMGLQPNQVEQIRKGGLLHDVGKLGIPEAILLKPGALTRGEFDIIKSHPLHGAQILEASRALQRFVHVAHHHHEHFDGTGYPDGLCGQAIPIEARIVALADAVDAMSSDRPYRKALPMNLIFQEIRTNTGTQFDPQVVQAFMNYIQEKGNKFNRLQDFNYRKEEIKLNQTALGTE
jgi:diguanylate cyclase (GGDEF)-like protein/putative nucleotidyltransferase with HDIG domain